MHSEFNISCGRGQGILVALPQQEVRVTKCGHVEWVRSQNWLCAWRCKDWHGLHESSYCYFKVYASTHNLKQNKISGMTQQMNVGLKCGHMTGSLTMHTTKYVSSVHVLRTKECIW